MRGVTPENGTRATVRDRRHSQRDAASHASRRWTTSPASMWCVIAHSSITREAAVAVDIDGASDDVTRRAARPGPRGPACRAARGSGPVIVGAQRHAARATVRSGPPPGSTPGPSCAAPSGAQPTLSPMPTTTAPDGCALGQDAGQLAAVEQHVVRPFQPRLDAGHRRHGVDGGDADRTCQVARLRRARHGTGSTSAGWRPAVRPTCGRAGRVRRSGARRPARCGRVRRGAPADRRWCCPSRRRTRPTNDRPRRPPGRASGSGRRATPGGDHGPDRPRHLHLQPCCRRS